MKLLIKTESIHLTWLFLVFGSVLVHSIPEPMARPTRPKVFTSPDELRRYLDLVKDYYTLNGRARYGKREDFSSIKLDLDHPWDILRMIFEARRQMQEEKNLMKKEEITEESRKQMDEFDRRDQLYYSHIVPKYYVDDKE